MSIGKGGSRGWNSNKEDTESDLRGRRREGGARVGRKKHEDGSKGRRMGSEWVMGGGIQKRG
jgi:hypothetical protein